MKHWMSKDSDQSEPRNTTRVIIPLLLLITTGVGVFFALRGTDYVELVISQAILTSEVLDKIRAGGKPAIDSLVNGLDDDDGDRRQKVLKAIQAMGTEGLPSLIEGVQDKRKHVSFGCALALADMFQGHTAEIPSTHEPELARVLASALGKGDLATQTQLVRCVQHLSPKYITPLVPRLKQLVDAKGIFRGVIRGLVSAGEPGVPVVAGVMQHSDNRIRKACAGLVSHIAFSSCMYKHSQPPAKMKRWKDSLAALLPSIQKALMDNDGDVRMEYLKLLNHCPDLASKSFAALQQVIILDERETIGLALKAISKCSKEELGPSLPKAKEVMERLIRECSPGLFYSGPY
jgi:hypothetical protein